MPRLPALRKRQQWQILSYSDDNISVTDWKDRQQYPSLRCRCDRQLRWILETALANNTYGTVTGQDFETAANNKAILAVNGDYYGANSTGYVIR